MKKVYRSEYEACVKELLKAEEELAKVQKYKGEVAIYQGDNWHDNPILYQTEAKENALIINVNKLREKVANLEIIKERDNTMIPLEEILNPKLVGNSELSDEEKDKLLEKQNNMIQSPVDSKLIIKSNEDNIEELMLYRIAFLTSAFNKTVDAKDIMLFLPKDYDVDGLKVELQRYITGKINIDNINDFTKNYLEEKVNISKRKLPSILELFSYQECISFIERFKDDFYNDYIVEEDIKIDDQILYNKNDIKAALFRINSKVPNYNVARDYFLMIFKRDFERIDTRLKEKYAKVYRSLPMSNPDREIAVKKSGEITKILKEDGAKIIRSYFKKLEKKPTKVFEIFVNNMEKYIGNDIDLTKYKEETINMLNKHQIPSDMLFMVLYLQYLFNKNKLTKEKQIVFNDETTKDNKLLLTLSNIFEQAGISIYTNDDIDISTYQGFDSFDLTSINKVLKINKED